MQAEHILRCLLIVLGILAGLIAGFICDQIDTWLITKHLNARYPPAEKEPHAD